MKQFKENNWKVAASAVEVSSKSAKGTHGGTMMAHRPWLQTSTPIEAEDVLQNMRVPADGTFANELHQRIVQIVRCTHGVLVVKDVGLLQELLTHLVLAPVPHNGWTAIVAVVHKYTVNMVCQVQKLRNAPGRIR